MVDGFMIKGDEDSKDVLMKTLGEQMLATLKKFAEHDNIGVFIMVKDSNISSDNLVCCYNLSDEEFILNFLQSMKSSIKERDGINDKDKDN